MSQSPPAERSVASGRYTACTHAVARPMAPSPKRALGPFVLSLNGALGTRAQEIFR